MPSIKTDDLDSVDLRMVLKALQGIDEDWLIIHIDKLLWNVLTRSRPGTSGNDDRCCHANLLEIRVQKYLSGVKTIHIEVDFLWAVFPPNDSPFLLDVFVEGFDNNIE